MGLLMSVTSPVSSGSLTTVVKLAGEADLNDSEALRALFAAESGDQTGTLILDLSGLLFMDSAILHLILVTARTMAGRGGTLALAAPREAVRRILSLTGADTLLPVYDSVAAACTA
jgi:anti-sigma B factor antagonist